MSKKSENLSDLNKKDKNNNKKYNNRNLNSIHYNHDSFVSEWFLTTRSIPLLHLR